MQYKTNKNKIFTLKKLINKTLKSGPKVHEEHLYLRSMGKDNTLSIDSCIKISRLVKNKLQI